jgi:hypothetical protein
VISTRPELATHQLLSDSGALAEGDGDGLGGQLLGDHLLDEGGRVGLGDLELGGGEHARLGGDVHDIDDVVGDLDEPLLGDERVAGRALVGGSLVPGGRGGHCQLMERRTMESWRYEWARRCINMWGVSRPVRGGVSRS